MEFIKNFVGKRALIIGALVMVSGFGAFASATTLSPAQPTHYMYAPTGWVNPDGHLVLGLHEISYALPGNLQVQLSLIDNIGKTNLAARYGINSDMSIGVGMASTFVSMGEHGIHSGPPRVGLFFAYDLSNSGKLDMTIIPHSQIGNNISIGGDFALKATPIYAWSFMFEGGLSLDLTDEKLYMYMGVALRVHPPSVPFLFIDIGISTNEFNLRDNPEPPIRARPFFDVIIAFIAK